MRHLPSNISSPKPLFLDAIAHKPSQRSRGYALSVCDNFLSKKDNFWKTKIGHEVSQ